MFTLENYNVEASLVYTNSEGKEIVFLVEPIINRRLRDTIEPVKTYAMLNSYIEYKGKEFRDTLYDLLVEAKNILILQATRKELNPMPFEIVHNVLDIFDFNDVYEFVKNSKYLNVPKNLPDKFDENIILNEKGTREQTYLINDYIELVTLITILKSVTGIIGNYAAFKDNILSNTTYKEYILFNFFKTHPIFKTRPFVKIYDSMDKLVDRMKKSDETTAIRIIERTLTLDSLTYYITAMVVIQKLLLNNELDDNDLRNTITKMHSFASAQLSLKDTGTKIRIKYFNDSDTDATEVNTSVYEDSRTNTNLPMGILVEYNLVSNDMLTLSRHLGLNVPQEIIDKYHNEFKKFITSEEYLPIEENISILSWIFKNVMDPRVFNLLDIDAIVRHMTIGFLYLVENDMLDLALMISSRVYNTDEFKINFSLRNKLKPELKETLDKIYPYMKSAVVNGVEKELNYAEMATSHISKQLMRYNLVSVISQDILKEDFGIDTIEVVISENIRNRLAELLIKLDNF